MLRTATLLVWTLLLTAAGATASFAQDTVAVRADVLFYGDNTEFRNPFREGETIFGASARVTLDAGLGERVVLSLGATGNQRFGGDEAFEQVRPVLALTLRGRKSAFTFGTFSPHAHALAPGPDLNGPHGLLPPLQRETLAFDRPYEAGFQWRFSGETLGHALWLNWQRVNTPEHRERFDGGANGRLRLRGPLRLPFQMHIVHQGGQLFRAGPVADSLALAAGLELRGAAAGLETAAIEAFGVASRFVPDRADDSRDVDGGGFLARASGQRAGWRGHLLIWRGKAVITDEGDPNYLSVRRDGSRYRSTRDYAEVGLTRLFRPDPRVAFHASLRVHRVEKDYGYSYRILGIVDAGWRVK